jgi:hypothetical protein
MNRALLVLVRDRPGEPKPASSWSIGRAAMALADAEVPIVFGQEITAGVARGLRVSADGTWERVKVPVGVVAMRFPRRSRPEPFEAALAGLKAAQWSIPIVNALPFSDLTVDKLVTQHALSDVVSMPEMELDAGRFSERVAEWDGAFLKPRYGSLGEGVVRLNPGEGIPDVAPGEWILQRAVLPPAGVAGVSLRVLVQREGDGWIVPTAVARVSDDDPTVSVERGARVNVASDVVGSETLQAVHADAVSIARWLADSGPWAPEDVVEMGVDFVVDRDGQPWTIEVNSIPRGRLAVLAALDERYAAEHAAAIERPLRRLLKRAAR